MVVAGFAAPCLLETTTRFAEAAAGLPAALEIAQRFAAGLRLYAA
jgi:hypothetical protein